MFHLQPRLTPAHLLVYDDARPNLSEVVHHTFLSECVGRPRVPFCWEVKQQPSSQGQKAECELAGNLSPAALHEPVQKQPAARLKHPGQLRPSACSPRPPHLSTAWLSRKMKCKLAICGLGGGGGTWHSWEMTAPEANRFSKATRARPAEPSDALEAPPARPGSRCLILPVNIPVHQLGLQASWGHRGRLPRGSPRRLRNASWTPWTASEGSSRECVVQFHVLSWKGLTWKQVLNKKYNQGKCYQY